MGHDTMKSPVGLTTRHLGALADWTATGLAAASLAAAILATGLLAASPAAAICTTPPGDVNASGNTNVTDAQCTFVATLWQVALANGVNDPPPPCLGGQLGRADLDCSGVITIGDAQQVITLALGNPLSPLIDANQDLCADACENATASCGNGIAEIGEECDDGVSNSNTLADFCRTTCLLPSCGDAVVDTGEQCDDGNSVPGDGCEDTCQLTGGAAFTLPYAENFDGGSFGAVGWTVESDAGSGANNWTVTTTGPLGGDAHARFFYLPMVSNFQDTLISPLIDASGTANLTLGFQRAFAAAGSDANLTLTVLASANGGTDWTTVWTHSGAMGGLSSGPAVLDLSAAAGGSAQARIAFRISGPTSGPLLYWEIDDIAVTAGAPPVLGAVQNITVTTGDTAQVPVSASDLDTPGTGLAFSLVNAPSFVSIADQNDGTAIISASPSAADAGTYPNVRVQVTDGTYTTSRTFQVTALAGTAGTPVYVLIRDQPNNGGAEVGAVSMDVGQTLTVYAASYNASGTYLGDVAVTWTASGTLNAVSAGPSSSVVFAPSTPATAGTLTATPANGNISGDTTGEITVNAPSGGGVDLAASTVDVVPGSIKVSSAELATVTVTVVDVFGLPVQGATVVIGASTGVLQGSVSETSPGVYQQDIGADATTGAGTITATVGGQSLSDTATIQIVDFLELTSPTTINCDNYGDYQDDNLLVKTTVTIDSNPTAGVPAGCGPMQFGDIIVAPNGILNHSETTTTQEYWMDIGVDSLVIQSGGRIDVLGKGYLGTTSNWSWGYPLVQDGAGIGVGGSHGGLGGLESDTSEAYGNLYDPRTLGMGGGRRTNNASYAGGDGGGAVRIVASDRIVIDGYIRATGTSTSGAGGAGGSISIDTPELTGAGYIEANGGAGNGSVGASGGGGRIALRNMSTLGGAFAPSAFATNVRAAGGTNSQNRGGAGTIFVKMTGDTYGRLVVDNNLTIPDSSTPILVAPESTNTTLAATTLTDDSAAFQADWLVGSYINPNTAQAGAAGGPSQVSLYEITSQTATSLATSSGNMTSVGTDGSAYRGVAIFDTVDVLDSAWLSVEGDLWVRSGNWLQGATGTYQTSGTIDVGELEIEGISAMQFDGGGLDVDALFTGGSATIDYAWTLSGSTMTMATMNASTVYASASTLDLGALDASGAVRLAGCTSTVGAVQAGSLYLGDSVSSAFGPVQATGDIDVEGGTVAVSTIESGRDFILRGAANFTVHDTTLTATRRVDIRDTAVLTHPPTEIGGPTERLSIAGQSLVVGPNSRIDLTGKGFSGWTANCCGYVNHTGWSVGNSQTYAAGNDIGGSHGGIGGGGTSANTYGDYTRPTEPGGGAGRRDSGGTSGAGGGALRIVTTAMVRIDGSIRVDGQSSNGGGAGGSIWVTTPYLTGAGYMSTNGGSSTGGSSGVGGGGGGRIAITGLQLRTGNFADSTIRDAFRSWGNNGMTRGGAGTVFVRHTNQAFGDLLVSNGAMGEPPALSTPVVLVPSGTSGTNASSVLFDGAAGWTPGRYAGTWVNPNIDQGGPGTPLSSQEIFQISANTVSELTVSGNVPLLSVAPGPNPYRGVLPLNRLEVAGRAQVDVQGDLLVLDGDISSGTGASTLVLEGDVTANVIDLNQINTFQFNNGGITASLLLTQGGAATPLHLSLTNSSQLTLPDLVAGSLQVDGSTLNIAGDIVASGNTRLAGTTLTAGNLHVGGLLELDGTTVDIDDLTADDLLVTGGTLTADRILVTNDVNLEQGAVVTIDLNTVSAGGLVRLTDANTRLHSCETDNTKVCALHVTAGSVILGVGTGMDVSQRGYWGTPTDQTVAWTVGNTQVGGAPLYAGGSHGGRGGYDPVNRPVFDRIADPIYPGGGGGRYTSTAGMDGGGIIRITATDFVAINGSLNADGGSHSNSGGGAGGTIVINAPNLGGTGTVTARGGYGRTSSSNGCGGGGGGRIAFRNLVNATGSFAVPGVFGKVLAHGGNGKTLGATNKWGGGAGTIYYGWQGQALGDLIIDNNGQVTNGWTTPISVVAEGVSSDIDGITGTLTDLGQQWQPGDFIGSRVNPNTAQPAAGQGLRAQDLYLVVANSETELSLVGTSDLDVVAPNPISPYRGVLAARNLEIRGGAWVDVPGDVLTEQGDLSSLDTTTFAISGQLRSNILDLADATDIDLVGGGIEANTIFGANDPEFAFDFELTQGTLTIPNVFATSLSIDGGTVTTDTLEIAQNWACSGSALMNVGDIDVGSSLDLGACTITAGALTTAAPISLTGSTATFSTVSTLSDITLDASAYLEITESNLSTSGTLRVLNGSTLTHCETDATRECALDITANSVVVGANAAIDVTGRGYVGAQSGGQPAYSLGNVQTNTAQNNQGGSHGGKGGLAVASAVYGSFASPRFPGAGGGWSSNGGTGGDGGGVVLIDAATSVVVNGAIRANGQNHTSWSGGGAGGSIRIHSLFVGGAGTLEAFGGTGYTHSSAGSGAGSGGRIALLDFDDLDGHFGVDQVADYAKVYGGNGRQDGGSGTVFLKSSSQSFGTLIFDNANHNKTEVDSSYVHVVPQAAVGATTDAPTKTLSDLGALWLNERYNGTFVNPNIAQAGASSGLASQSLFRITNHTVDTLTLSGAGSITALATTNDTYRGVLVLDHLVIRRGADVRVAGDVLVMSGDPAGSNTTFTLDGFLRANQVDFNSITKLSLNSGGLLAQELYANGQSDFAFDLVLGAASLDENVIHAGTIEAAGTGVFNAASIVATDDVTFDGTTLNVGDVTTGGELVLRNANNSVLGVVQADGFLMQGGTAQIEQVYSSGSARLDGGANLTITNDVVDVNGSLEIVGANTTLTHAETDQLSVYRLDVAADIVLIGPGAKIDVSGRGYLGGQSGVGATGYAFGNTTSGGAGDRVGGSHGGIGSIGNGSATVTQSFDSLYDPQYPGGGGGYNSGFGGDGGGVVWIDAATALVVDGAINASGANGSSNGGGGAGGSVRIVTPILLGDGQITADGGNRGNGNAGGGGGGRVAITGLTFAGDQFDLPTIWNGVSARGAIGRSNIYGGAGTIYVATAAQAPWGTLLVDNGGFASEPKSTPLVSLGTGTVFAEPASNQIQDNTVAWAANFYAGSWVNPNLNQGGTARLVDDTLFPVTSNNLNTLTVTGDIAAVSVVGQPYRGAFRFANLEVRGAAHLATVGDLIVTEGDLTSGDTTTLVVGPNVTIDVTTMDIDAASLVADPTAVITGTILSD